MHWVHFYPFTPVGEHGGTLRLRTAQAACSRLGDEQLFWFDRASASWTNRRPESSTSHSQVGQSLKRRLFPSTLYESGRLAVKAFRGTDWAACLPSRSTAILHTTYLAPLLLESRLRQFQNSVLDVYDLVWRAHAIDADHSSALMGTTRRVYSDAVRRREMAALSRADAVAVAGYADWSYVNRSIDRADWCPTGIAVPPQSRPHGAHDKPTIGFLGNFAHQPTVDSARLLLKSPAARSGGVRVLLGGWESEGFRPEFSDQAEILGPVESPTDLWSKVDCAVIPVQTGAGMKCKISEALLAGRPVITTAIGAEGFPPDVGNNLHVVNDLDDITALLCEQVARTKASSAAALEPLTIDGAASRYEQLLKKVA
jgi:hypothetical protein